MANLGALVVSLEANIAKYTSDMGKAADIAEQRMRQIDKSIGIVKSGLSALGIGFAFGATFDKIKDKIEGAIASAAGLQQLSERTGVAVDALSGLVAVAKLSATDTDQLATGLQKLSKAMVDAENGGNKTGESFKAIGISVADLEGKKPDQVFQMVARALAGYQDGAEKLVITQNLLGKAGANLLPVLKDLADAGELQVKVTAEQAEVADELEKNQVRLKASTDAIFKKIGLELVPVFNAFTLALMDAQNANDGVRGSVDKLAKDGSIRDWAESGAKMVAFVIDAFEGVSRTVEITGKWIGAAAAQAVMLAHGQFSAAAAVGGALKQDIDAILTKQLFSARLQKQIDDARAHPHEAADRKKIDTSNLGNANEGPKDDPAKAAMEGVIKNQEAFIARAKKLSDGYQQDLDFYARMQYMTEAEVLDNKKSVIEQELTASEAGYAIELAAAQRFIDHEKSIGNEKGQQEGKNVRQEVLNKQIAAELDAEQKIAKILQDRGAIQRNFDLASNDVARQNGLANDAMQFQIDLLGKNTLEVAKLASAKAIQLALDERIRQARLKDANVDVSGAIAQAAIEQAQAAALIEESYNKQRDASFGASEALRKYGEEAANTGAQIEGALTGAFRSAEDALVNFCMTGKMDFKSFAMSILADLDRIIIKEQLAALYKNSMSGSSGFLGGLIGGAGASEGAGAAMTDFGLAGFADGGRPPLGRASMVGENGPELFVPDGAGTIIPNDKIGGSSGSSQPINITVNVNGNNSAPDVRRAAGQGAREALQAMAGAQRFA